MMWLSKRITNELYLQLFCSTTWFPFTRRFAVEDVTEQHITDEQFYQGPVQLYPSLPHKGLLLMMWLSKRITNELYLQLLCSTAWLPFTKRFAVEAVTEQHITDEQFYQSSVQLYPSLPHKGLVSKMWLSNISQMNNSSRVLLDSAPHFHTEICRWWCDWATHYRWTVLPGFCSTVSLISTQIFAVDHVTEGYITNEQFLTWFCSTLSLISTQRLAVDHVTEQHITDEQFSQGSVRLYPSLPHKGSPLMMWLSNTLRMNSS